jgi:hypothetical protein
MKFFTMSQSHVVRASLLKKSLEVVCRRPRLALATVHGCRDAPHARAVCFLVIVVIVVSHSHNPIRAPLMPLLATLGAPLGILDGGGGWCRIAAA